MSDVPPCPSLSAYRGAAVLFKFLDVIIAAAQPVPRLVGGFYCAASFDAHGAERDGGTAIEWCARCLASREIARRYGVTVASRAARHKPQYWTKAPNGGVVHDATSTVDPALDRLVGLSSQRARTRARVVHYSITTRLVLEQSGSHAARVAGRNQPPPYQL
jgi:hypothetical protein